MYLLAKRIFDVVFSLVVLLMLLPLFVLVAAAIKLTSKGPVFYQAARMGKNGIPFTMYKFRSMVIDADKKGKTFVTSWNQDITRVGKILRASKIDELPQFINILKGDMAVVGPRPEVPEIVRLHYTEEEKRILDVRPGLTCFTQVRYFPDLSHKTPPHVDSEQYYIEVLLREKLKNDLEYLARASFSLDVYLVLQTAYLIVFKGLPHVFMRNMRKSTPLSAEEPINLIK